MSRRDPLRYTALALQTRCDAVNALSPEDARVAIRRAITRIGAEIAACAVHFSPPLSLVVLPEYVLTGFPLGEDAAAWKAAACLRADGPEMAELAAVAEEHRIHLCVNAYEEPDDYPELYFQTTYLIDPAGEIVLRYRRLISMYSPTPYDVWESYLDRYGEGGVFPVAETAIGRFGAVASEEILYPEIARAAVFRGAEVLLNPNGEISAGEQTPRGVCRRARALENTAYLVSANAGGLLGTGLLRDTTDGPSEVIDYTGRALAVSGGGETIAAAAVIDIPALRDARATPGMGNLLSRQPGAAWAAAYSGAPGMEPGGLDAGSAPGRDFYRQRQRKVLEKLARAGLI